MPNVDSLEELLQDELKDIYDAEKQLTKALPKMVKKATANELKQAFQDHLGQTEEHVKRLEEVFEQLREPGADLDAARCLVLEMAGRVLAEAAGDHGSRPTPTATGSISDATGRDRDQRWLRR